MKEKSFITTLLVLLLSIGSFAQIPIETTIDTTFINLKSSYIFVSIKNTFTTGDSSGCPTAKGSYGLRFRLENKGELVGYPAIIVDGVVKKENNQHQKCIIDAEQYVICKDTSVEEHKIIANLRANDTIMYSLTKSHYNLAFRLPYGTTKEDTLSMCIEQGLFPIICEGCALGGFDREFNPKKDIAPNCPYKGADVLACGKRQSRQQNWEAWIMDKRDCQFYRIVQMPDNRWWLARNLNYQGTRQKPLKFIASANAFGDGNASLPRNTFWCPGGSPNYGVGTVSADATRATASVLPVCATYGALYPWSPVMSDDGYATNPTTQRSPVPFNVTSTTRAICPEGWYVPSSFDWGKLINLVENECGGNCPTGNNSTGSNTSVPCYHNATSTHSYWSASSCAFKDLLSTNIAPTVTITGSFSQSPQIEIAPNTKLSTPDTIRTYADAINANWNYFLQERAGTDRYGFALLPTGMRGVLNGVYYFYYRGEFAGIWTSSASSSGHTGNAQMRGFRYNYIMNKFTSAIQSYSVGKPNGYGVRCIAASH
ncbi:MAG: FISUMP domain-containing protein [Bacteroidales bacterium]